MTGNEWRPILAALNNENARLALAEVVLAEAAAKGTKLSDVQREKALRSLAAAALIHQPSGASEFNAQQVRTVLATDDGGQQHSGNERFMRNGRIDRYPANHGQKREFLTWLAGQVLKSGEILDERGFNDRLSQLTADVALLRRYLVDEGLVARTPSGTEYWLIDGDADSGSDIINDGDGKIRG